MTYKKVKLTSQIILLSSMSKTAFRKQKWLTVLQKQSNNYFLMPFVDLIKGKKDQQWI